MVLRRLFGTVATAGRCFSEGSLAMACHAWSVAVAAALLLASGAVAEDVTAGNKDRPGSRIDCAAPKPLREMPQDETRTIPELCGWRDDSLQNSPPNGEARETTLVQHEEPAAPKINLSMEQRHIIREIVLKDLKPKRASADSKAGIGDSAPAGANPQPFPPEVAQKVPQIKSHRFFVRDDQIVIVNPTDDRIEDVIE
jgi:hypothetical protein